MYIFIWILIDFQFFIKKISFHLYYYHTCPKKPLWGAQIHWNDDLISHGGHSRIKLLIAGAFNLAHTLKPSLEFLQKSVKLLCCHHFCRRRLLGCVPLRQYAFVDFVDFDTIFVNFVTVSIVSVVFVLTKRAAINGDGGHHQSFATGAHTPSCYGVHSKSHVHGLVLTEADIATTKAEEKFHLGDPSVQAPEGEQGTLGFAKGPQKNQQALYRAATDCTGGAISSDHRCCTPLSTMPPMVNRGRASSGHGYRSTNPLLHQYLRRIVKV